MAIYVVPLSVASLPKSKTLKIAKSRTTIASYAFHSWLQFLLRFKSTTT
jgi:hypothetical protein